MTVRSISNLIIFFDRSETSANSRKHQKFLSKVPCITNTTLNVLRVFGELALLILKTLPRVCFQILIKTSTRKSVDTAGNGAP